ncbi:YCII-related domain [Nakaseomyces bracarensis]|uniref:YCII-related domain n=1 Tax=Nakaseomyces bracarensis TaxID=273131 RepID=A0ABR4P0G6_9SACH
MVEWCAIVYDKPGSDRSTCRPEHLANIPPLVQAGKLVCAGAIYHDPEQPGGERKFAGSHLQIVAESREEALALIHNDVFAKNGIWDLDNIILYQFGCAVREPKA